MSKFKVGDKVRILENADSFNDPKFAPGTVHAVNFVPDCGGARLIGSQGRHPDSMCDGEGAGWYFMDDELELVASGETSEALNRVTFAIKLLESGRPQDVAAAIAVLRSTEE